MHELSIALSIVDGVLEEAARHGEQQVEVVHLRLGHLSGVDKDALLFSYRVACEDTPLAHSRLEIDDIPIVIYCPKCRADRPTGGFLNLRCGDCGSPGERIVHGEEMEIIGLELAA